MGYVCMYTHICAAHETRIETYGVATITHMCIHTRVAHMYIYTHMCVYICVYTYMYIQNMIHAYTYGMATISRLLQIIGHFCKIYSLL